MVGVLALWLPILVAAVLVFVASSIIHMFLPYHRTDYGKVPDEDAVMDAMRGFDGSPDAWPSWATPSHTCSVPSGISRPGAPL